MHREGLDELLTEVLVIKDLYICGRMNQSICNAVVESGNRAKYSQNNWRKYEDLSEAYKNDSIDELVERKDFLTESLTEFGPVTLSLIFDTTYDDFDEDLFNDMMKDFYGGMDTVAFAASYNRYSEDFNALISEFVLGV